MRHNQISRVVILVIVFVLITPLLATSTNIWSTPVNLTGWEIMEFFRFISGSNGTQAVFYPVADLVAGTGTLWARVRSTDGSWSAAEDLSGPVAPLTVWGPLYWDVTISPDGTTWAVWSILDGSKPPGQDVFVMESHRTPGGSWSTPVTLSAGVTDMRSIDLQSGPDGHVAVGWVECDTTSTDLSQGNCKVNIRQRAPGAVAWEPVYQADLSAAGVAQVDLRVGPGGLAVVVWNEASAVMLNMWAVMSKTYVPGSGWQVSPDNISGWIQPRDDRFLAEPLMDAGGTFVAAWTAMTSPGATTDANYSNTRSSGGSWAAPVKISNNYPAGNLELPTMAVGQDGILVAAWVASNGSTSKGTGLYANVREPGQPWGSEQLLSNLEDSLTLAGIDIWPGGSILALWVAVDTAKPASQSEGLFWSIRTSGAWGSGGQGQLGNWMAEVNGADLITSPDGSATVLWAVIDSNQPSNMQGQILFSSWPPGGPWEPIQNLAGGYESAYITFEGLQPGLGAESLGAAWLVGKNLKTSNFSAAVYYASTVHPNTAPTAVFEIDPPSGPTSTNFQFDASACSDNEDPSSALEVRWDWEDDGTFDTNWSTTKTISHQYQTPNTYQVRLQVRDADGLMDTFTKPVTVTGNGSAGEKYLYLPMAIR